MNPIYGSSIDIEAIRTVFIILFYERYFKHLKQTKASQVTVNQIFP